MASTKRRSRTTPKSKPVPETIPPEVVTLHGVDYFVRWKDLTVGASFFMPTTGTAKQVKEALREAERYYQYQLVVHTRVEYGRYGARVWRVY